MNIEEVRAYCLALPFTTEDFPFDENTLVIRIGKKIFALIPLEKKSIMNLKCEPERAIELREKHEGIQPGYHMNKKYWNTIQFDSIPSALVKELIEHSYNLVIESLPKKIKQDLRLSEKES